MTKQEIITLAINRRESCGMGLSGKYDSIARWFLQEHNIVTTGRWIEFAIKQRNQQEPQE